MFSKKTLKSKTFWLGIVLVAKGIIHVAQGDTQNGVEDIRNGMILIVARDAVSKIT